MRLEPSLLRTRVLLAASLSVALLYAPRPLAAQDSASRPVPIQDNSFLIEEAYNQESHVVQHIGTFMRGRTGRDWASSFTQEWPAMSQRHQLSFTIPIVQPGADHLRSGVGDVALNYRYQAAGLHGERTAFAPRLTVLLPTGDADNGMGAGGAGVQTNLPVSVQLSDRFVTHLNAGATLTPRTRAPDGATARTIGFNVGQSLIWLATARINGMLEVSWADAQHVVGPGRTETQTQFFVSPGLRWAYNLAHDTQVVPGIAFPIGVGPSHGTQSVFLYFSVEHPF